MPGSFTATSAIENIDHQNSGIIYKDTTLTDHENDHGNGSFKNNNNNNNNNNKNNNNNNNNYNNNNNKKN